ncbi:MAG: hydrogenase formation protein HypD, partial [Fibrobacter sp.]|nr:hydrogenase formation protein HypD [Fibrobacter sp.]
MNKFTDKELFKKCLDRISHNASRLERIRIMEVCGTHTMEIGRSGLRSILPENIELISGPGCPVCVTPGSIIDTACDLSLKGPVILTFGDMIRVPGNRGSLEHAQSNGGKVEAILTPLHAIAIAKENPGKTFIFIAAGFETTIPAIARTVEIADEQKIDNLFFLVAHRTVPPALSALIQDKEVSIDGFLLPGHVCAITGLAPFSAVLDKKYPSVVTGFEALDIIMSIMMITDMLVEGRAETVNMYRRVARDYGNPLAVRLIERVFKPVDAVWRGIGTIPQSGLALNDEYVKFDA